jgi:hypothetical protein
MKSNELIPRNRGNINRVHESGSRPVRASSDDSLVGVTGGGETMLGVSRSNIAARSPRTPEHRARRPGGCFAQWHDALAPATPFSLVEALDPPCEGHRSLCRTRVTLTSRGAFRQGSPGRTPEYAECVPRPRRDLTTTEKRHLHSLEGRIARLETELQATRREWAELVEEAGQAAVARELGVTRQAIADRLRRIRADREGRSGRR